MKQTFDSFKQRQAGTLTVLQNLHAFLEQGESFGVEIDANLKAKLAGAIRDVEGGKLRVALIGGFSEGKTAIAAAWLEKLDKSTMNISAEESSNAVRVYDAGPDCELIDTPGLFGFKEQADLTTGAVEKYKALTRKYVSEAHIVMYVMDPTNPIKNSHAEDINWLFRELNLLPRTVFVLSRFDAVADVEDDDEYSHHFDIKKANVISRLRDEIKLTESEADALAIVAVAANPFDLGVEHWLADLVQFRKLSRIPLLQRATSEKVSSAGGVAGIVDETRRSIVRDILHRQLPVVVANDEKIAAEVERLSEVGVQLERQLATVEQRIKDARSGVRSFVMLYFTDLIMQVGSQSMQTFPEFFERKIGAEGIVLNTTLEEAFDTHLSAARLEVGKMTVGFVAEVDHFNATMRTYGKQGLDYAVKSGFINNKSILATRDGVVNIAKMAGLDIGKMLKFNPWGAVNLAKGINGALVGVGLLMEVYDTYDRIRQENAFKDAVQTMKRNLETQRAELIELINDASFEDRFFPQMAELKQDVDNIKISVTAGKEKRKVFQNWRKHGEAVNSEFRMLVSG
jgi:hypothetical protein